MKSASNRSRFTVLTSAAFLTMYLLCPIFSGAQTNTMLGYRALQSDTTGIDNTAIGANALVFNTSGNSNSASGAQALYNNTTGYFNTAAGTFALYNNTTGNRNAAHGISALYNNTTGYDNTASGAYSLWSNTTGFMNTANGSFALHNSTEGIYNTANGTNALYYNTTGNDNTAIGVAALCNNINGYANLGVGYGAGNSITSGSGNISLGAFAGNKITTGNSNIAIGNNGQITDSGIIRIGTSGAQEQAYIAGISGVGVTGAAVYVTTSGQLGVLKSSERFKYDIQDVGSASDRLMSLRPVTFRYKDASENGSHPIQYGLIAEEVAKIYPDLVQYDKQGKPFTVYYHLLTPIMLDQLQKAHYQLEEQRNELNAFKTAMQGTSSSLQSQVTSLQHSNKLMAAGAGTLLLFGLVAAAMFASSRSQSRSLWRTRRIAKSMQTSPALQV